MVTITNFNQQCLKGSCSQYTSGKVRDFIGTETIAPFVIAKIIDQSTNFYITVGNESSPLANVPNSAVIKSFQWGQSNGCGVTLEIIDEDGAGKSGFENFFQKVVHSPESADRYTLDVTWGWIGTDCNGFEYVERCRKQHKFLVTNVQIKFEHTLKFIIEGTDSMQWLYQTRTDKTYGTERNPMKLKDALQQLFRDSTPPVNHVHFKRKHCDFTNIWDFDTKAVGVWTADQQHPLATAMRWIRDFKTENGKGVIPAWDDTAQEPTIVFWEDTETGPDDPDCQSSNLGTFIVNGGQCSPVISFTPDIMWNFAAVSEAGGNVDTLTGEGSKQNESDNSSNMGTTTSNVITQNAHRNYGKNAGKESQSSDKEHTKSAQHFDGNQPIKAELKIFGDPSLDDNTLLFQSTIGIVVINPFHIRNNSINDDCPDWLAQTTCNNVLSSRDWYIHGIVHDIREGSYTTTFKLYLGNPGNQFESN